MMPSMLNALMQQQAGAAGRNPLIPMAAPAAPAAMLAAPPPPAAAAAEPAPSPATGHTPWQAKMHAMADAAHAIGENPAMGELPGGTHPAAFERHREMMMAMKTMAKHGDHVLGEIARVGGNGDVDHDGAVWDHVKDGAHDDVRALSSEMRHDLRDEINHHVDGARPHPDIRHHARAFADDVRRVADDPDNGYIERARGDDQDHHPQDVHAMADQAEGVTAALDELLTHMNTSAHAHYVKGALQEKPIGLDSRVSVHDELRRKADAMAADDA